MIYRLLFDHVLTRIDAEDAHHSTMRLLGVLSRQPWALRLVRSVLGRIDPALAVSAMGLTFPSPLGLAAGFDKDAEVVDAMAAVGFGFVEVGTVTAHAQLGNPRPRMARLPADRALVNRMGFNNRGAAHAAVNLARRRGDARVPVGGNIGKSKVTTPEAAVLDYRMSASLLAPHCDYLVVNVSSPNTPGLRDLQATESLRPILQAVLDAASGEGAEGPRRPVLVKIAPDLADADVDAVADLALELGLDGIIATNTTITREGLASSAAEVKAAGGGGLSGSPLHDRSLAVLQRLRARVGDRLTLVSVGGISTADDVWERLQSGADLVQAYTGLVYGGPVFARQVNDGLSTRVREAGGRRLQDVVGPR